MWDCRRVDSVGTMKRIAIIPTLLTLGNGVCGFAAIVCASKIDSDHPVYFAVSAWLIFSAMIFDSLDGYVARLARSASEFGGQLDSLCDIVSFGVAPAFLLLRLGEGWEVPIIRQTIVGIAVLYMVCAILRLARFNVENNPDPASHKRFKGLPSPAAAGCLASLALLRAGPTWPHGIELDQELLRRWVTFWSPLGTLLVALLMVSRVSYPHMTKQFLRGRRHFSYLVRIVLAVFVLAITRELAIVLLFWVYALFFPMRYMVLRIIRGRSMPAPATGLEDGLRH